jgi:putative transposase
VRAAHEAGRRTNGRPRVLRELRAQQVYIGRKRIMRLMRAEGLRARVRRRYRCTTMSEHSQPIAPNLLARNFQPAMRNQSWASDTTELVTGSGKLYLGPSQLKRAPEEQGGVYGKKTSDIHSLASKRS